jgi:hypothetical protein
VERPACQAAARKGLPGFREPTGHLLLAAPVFLLYHLGLLVSPLSVNGVDPVTRLLGHLAGLSWWAYLAAMLGLLAAYLWAWRRLARRGDIAPGRLARLLAESGLYAVLLGPLAGALLGELHVLGAVWTGMGPLDRVVASAGAGFYEELFFRLLAVGAVLGWLDRRGHRRWLTVPLVVAATALLFAAVHHVGPGAEPFSAIAFSFRTVLGGLLAAVFLLRGFATAVWTHFLYDVYVMVVLWI